MRSNTAVESANRMAHARGTNSGHYPASTCLQLLSSDGLVRRLRSMRAACCCMLGAWSAAVDDLEKAAELQPCAGAHARLAEARLQLGDYEGALSALAAAQQAEDAAECVELPALKAEIVERANASSSHASAEPQRPARKRPDSNLAPEPNVGLKPELGSELEPAPESEPEPESGANRNWQSSSPELCRPCNVSPTSAGKYCGSLCWDPGSSWPLPFRGLPLDANVSLTDWGSALADRMPSGSVPSELPVQVIDGLSFPYSVAWAMRQLSFLSMDQEFHVCVLGASARVEQRLMHADDEQPGGYWIELLHLCRCSGGDKTVLPSLVVHLVGPEVTVEDPHTIELAEAGSLRVEYHDTDALSFIDAHPSLFQRSVVQDTSADRKAYYSTTAGWRCLAVTYNSGFGTGDAGLLRSWLPVVRRLITLEVPTVCTCPNLVVDGAGEVAVLTQAFGARVINLYGEDLAAAEAIANPFAGASLHPERDTSGLIDLSWRPNHFIYAFSGRLNDAEPMPEMEDQADAALAHKMGCSGLLCVANHALMFAKMRRVADQLR